MERKIWTEKVEQCVRLGSPDRRLPREFFLRDGITVARELLGKILVHETRLGTVRGVITETESYMGWEDKGSHTYGGRRTARTEPMYHIGGTSYVYFTYGMYHCMNITAGEAEVSQAALLRGVEPLDEISRRRMLSLRLESALARRRRAAGEDAAGEAAKAARSREKLRRGLEDHLADGPGRLCIAMEIGKAQNDVDMVESGSFFVTEGLVIGPGEIRAGKRIGIGYAQEAADYLWRFYL